MRFPSLILRRGAVVGLILGLIPGCILDWTPPSLETDGGPRCGNGVLEPGESCDGTDLGGTTCQDLEDFDTGQLRCTEQCTLDTSHCEKRCGNGVVDAVEECDGTDLGGQDCQSLGLEEGTLVCTGECTFDRSGCPGCGNGIQEPGELCDGTDLGGLTCTGTLACGSDCTLDTSGCLFSDFGDGQDGSLDVTVDMSLSGPAGAYSVVAIDGNRITVGEPPGMLRQDDKVILINMQGDSNDCWSAGNYEFATVGSTNGNDVLLQDVVHGTYGVNGDNADLTGQRIVLQRVMRYSTVTIRQNRHLYVDAWGGQVGGLLVLQVSEELVIESGGSLHVDEKGYRGGPRVLTIETHGRPGESKCGYSQTPDTENWVGGGGGGKWMDGTNGDCGQGGGGGGYGTAGVPGEITNSCFGLGNTDPADNGGDIYGVSMLTQVFLGSGAGSGALDNHAYQSGFGGRGGGIVLLFAKRLVVQGTISARGGNGGQSNYPNNAGNGGGGSGGTISLKVLELLGTGSISAEAGLGNLGDSDWNSAGGNGGPGRIRIDFLTAGGHPFGTVDAGAYLDTVATPDPGHTEMYLE